MQWSSRLLGAHFRMYAVEADMLVFPCAWAAGSLAARALCARGLEVAVAADTDSSIVVESG